MSRTLAKIDQADHAPSIWWFAFGYFACYVPYASLTKALSSDMTSLTEAPVAGLSLLPMSAMASLVGMILFITTMGWWKYAGRKTVFGTQVPSPNRWTLLSGLCTTGIIATTTLAYTFSGISIVFMMLLLRGGVLILAPIVDAVAGRKVRWFSAMALILSLAALVVAFLEDKGFALTATAALDVGVYLSCYFVRLRFMSRLAKSDDPNASRRYFVEEQIVATPLLLLGLAVCALIGGDGPLGDIRAGFTELPSSAIFVEVLVIGLFSQGTGIFGGLILLDRRENTFCVPVNRSSSMLASVVGSYALMTFADGRAPSPHQLAGAGLIIFAIVVLTAPTLLAKARGSAR